MDIKPLFADHQNKSPEINHDHVDHTQVQDDSAIFIDQGLQHLIRCKTMPREEIDKKIDKLEFLKKSLQKLLVQKIKDMQESKFIFENFMQDKYNSMLIHGESGSGKTRVCEELDFHLWMQRKVTNFLILKKITDDEKMYDILSNFTIEDIYSIMQKYDLIDQDGFFTDFFLEIESEFEDIKSANRIRKEQQQDEKEGEEYTLQDIQSESGQKFFQKKFAKILEEFDKKVVMCIYQILDDHFQTRPFPIYVQLSTILQPQKELLKEALQSSFYNFDDCHVRKVRELAQQGDINLVFILDGYNEMRPQFQSLNIFCSNDLQHLKKKDDQKFAYPKIITTCRSNFLNVNDDYSSNFQNIFQKHQRAEYQPSMHYLEYQIDVLNNYQIQHYFQQKFVISLKKICYHRFNHKYKLKDNLQQQFESFWDGILNYLKDNQEYDQPWIRIEFVKYLIQKFKSSEVLNPMNIEEQNKFSWQLNQVYTQRRYEKIVNDTKIQFFLNNFLMISILIDAIERLITRQCSKNDLILRIKSALAQEEFLKNHNKLTSDIIIQLLTNGEHDLLERFSFNDFGIQKQKDDILKAISKNYLITSDEQLREGLSNSICFAMYYNIITRYMLYEVFYANFIKKQIKILKTTGQLCVTQDLMLRDCNLFAQKLAAAFHSQGKTVFQKQDPSQIYWEKNMWDEFFNDQELPIRKLIRQCLPFVNSGNIFHFIHISIKEFILAHQYYEMVNSIDFRSDLYIMLIKFKDSKNLRVLGGKQSLNNSHLLLSSQILEKKDEIKEEEQSKEEDENLDMFQAFLLQTKETIRHEIQQNLKYEITQILQKEINEIKESLDIKKDKGTDHKFTYLESLVNNTTQLQEFGKFYRDSKKIRVKVTDLKEQIQNFIQQTQKVVQLELNKNSQFYNFKNMGICNFLVDKMKILDIPEAENRFIHNLHVLIQLGKLDDRYGLVAANAIGILIFRKSSFTNINFSGINFHGTNLYGGQFYHCIFNNCNLESTNLSFSILYKCIFSNSNLSHALMHNCNMSKSKFNNNTLLNDIQLGRHLDISYYDQEIQSDHLLFVTIDPFKKQNLLIFHTKRVFEIDMKGEGGFKILKQFDQQLSRCGLVQYSKQQNFYIVGVENKLALLQLKTMTLVDFILLSDFEEIISIQYNQQNNDVLIGVSVFMKDSSIKSYKKYQNEKTKNPIENDEQEQKKVYVGKFKGDSIGQIKLLTKDYNKTYIDYEKQQIICYSEYQNFLVKFNLTNYQLIQGKQVLDKPEQQKNHLDIKKFLDLQKNRILQHPTLHNIIISLTEVVKGIHEIIVEKEEEQEQKQYHQDGTYSIKIKKQKRIINQIRTQILNSNKHGKASQILVNPEFPKIIICAYSRGLIRRFQFQGEEDEDDGNCEIFKDHLQVTQIPVLLPQKDKTNCLLTYFIKDHYNGIVTLAKFKFQVCQEHQIKQFTLNQSLELKIRHKLFYNKFEDSMRHDVIGMENHKKLDDKFILVVLQNQEDILRYIINNELSLNQKQKSNTVKLSEVDINDQQFSNYKICQENYDIFYFCFSGSPMNIIIFNVESLQRLCKVEFDLTENWKFYFDDSINFQRIIAYNLEGQIKTYTNIEIYKDVEGGEQGVENIKSLKNSHFFDPQQEYHLTTVVGIQPQKPDILFQYDYLTHTIIEVNMQTGLISKNIINTIFELQQKSVPESPPKSHSQSQNNFMKSGTACKIKKDVSKYFNNVQTILEEYCKKKHTTLTQALQDQKERILKKYQKYMQLSFHPTMDYLFIIFRGKQIMLIYCIKKKSIVQLVNLPFYFDLLVKLNIVSYVKNTDICMVSYSSSIMAMKFNHEDEQFQIIFRQNMSGAVFQCQETNFDTCQMTQETYNILEQNGAYLNNCQYICSNYQEDEYF